MALRTVALLLVTAGCSPPERAELRVGEVDGARADAGVDGSPDAAGALPTAPEAASDPQRSLDPVVEAVGVGRGWTFAVRACPKGYAPMPASTFDDACQCNKSVFIGCVPEGASFNSIATCFKRRGDGLIILTGGPVEDLLGSAWMPCAEEDWGDVMRR